MKTPSKTISLLATAALFTLSSLSAVETDPVGYVTFAAANNSDLLVGVPLTQSPVFTGVVDSVTTGEVTFAATVPDLSTSTYFLLITTDADPLEGQWFTVTDSGASSIIVAEDLAGLGVVANDTISIYPYWTLDTLFPSGGGVPASSNVLSPSAVIITNDVTGSGVNLPIGPTYLYHSGEQLAAGWYDANNLGGGSAGNTVLTPETYMTLRNNSGTTATIIISGAVPTGPIANNIISSSSDRQDNQVLNPFPSSFTLANSNLVTSGAFSTSSNVLTPSDRLFVYSTTSSSIRPAPDKTFIYHSGEQLAAGWYDENNLGGGLQDGFEIPAGSALVIRRSQGSDATVAWSPTLPYSL